MRTNVGQVIKILSSESLRKQKPEVHDVVLKAIATTDDLTFRGATHMILKSYDEDRYRHDEYWIPIFFACLVGNFDKADVIVEQLIALLPSDRYANVSRAYPPLFIALLKAFNSAEQHTDTANPIFVERFPEYLSNVVCLCSAYGTSQIDDWNPKISDMARRSITVAMDDYFHRGHPNFWTRMETFCTNLEAVAETVGGGPEFLRIVAEELNSHMPPQMAAKAAARAWLDAKRRADANQNRV